MEALLEIVGRLAPWVQLVVCLFIAIIFRAEIVEIAKAAVGIKKDEPGKQERVPIWAQTLIGHFNHETTDNQERIQEGLQQILGKQASLSKDIEKLCKDIDDIRVNGIRIRK